MPKATGNQPMITMHKKTIPFFFAKKISSDLPDSPICAVGKRTYREMILPALMICLGIWVTACDTNTNGERPALRMPPARLVAIIDSTDRANYAAASINFTRDVAAKKLRLYASTPKVETGVRKIGEYEVEVIYHPELVAEEKTCAGAYHLMYDGKVFSFAIAQFAAGNKDLGLSLVKLIAETQPDYWWSSPSHPPMMIKDIIAGLEKEDESVKEVLKEETEEWTYILNKYGP
jgi:hypothetical protein